MGVAICKKNFYFGATMNKLPIFTSFFLTACASEFKIFDLESNLDAEVQLQDVVNNGMGDYTDLCYAYNSDTPWSNRPEDALGVVFRRDSTCSETTTSSSCAWTIAAGEIRTANITTEETDTTSNPETRFTVNVQDAMGTALLGWLGIEMNATSAIVMTRSDIFDGTVVDDDLLYSEIDRYLGDHGDQSLSYQYVNDSKLFALKIQEYYLIGEEPPLSRPADGEGEIAAFNGLYYQDSTLELNRNILSICAKPINY